MQGQVKSNPPVWFIEGDTKQQTFVLTLCGLGSIEPQVLASKRLIESRGYVITLGRYLSTDTAYDIQFDAASPAAWYIFQQLVAELPKVDIALQPLLSRPKRLLICDMDKTIVDAETLDEVAELVGIGEQVSAITEQAMRGEIDFDSALRYRVGLLAGHSAQVFAEVLDNCRLNPGAEALLASARAAGIYTVLVSGGFDLIADPIAKQLGFDEVHSNRLVIRDGLLTGDLIAPIIDGNAKRALLLSTAKKLNITPDQCCAIGDGANDIPMLQLSGLGIAYQGKPATRAATAYQINLTNLQTAQHFMGLVPG
jgi:phosphoserine phosphatase